MSSIDRQHRAKNYHGKKVSGDTSSNSQPVKVSTIVVVCRLDCDLFTYSNRMQFKLDQITRSMDEGVN